MKNVNVLVSYVAIVAVIVLFILQFNGKGKNDVSAQNHPSVAPANNGESLPVAFVNTDSLLLNYSLAKDLNEQLIKQQEDARTDLNEEARVLESELREHQRKIQNNGYLSLDRARAEEARLQQSNNRITELSNKLSNEIAEKQMKVSEQLRDSIVNYLEVYNNTHNYELILSSTLGGNILFSKKQYNITGEVLNALNARYKK